MKSFRICNQNIRKWTGNKRILMILILMLFFTRVYTKNVVILAINMGKTISPWLLPFLLNRRYMKIIYLILVVFIFCDAPFIDTNQPYVFLRCNRNIWSIGQVLYIIIGSFIMVTMLFVSTIIVNIRYIRWDSTWGDVISYASVTNVLANMGLSNDTIGFSGKIVKYFSPLQAIAFTTLLLWMSFMLIGLIIYVINIITRSQLLGILTVSFLVMLSSGVDMLPGSIKERAIWFSPFSWNTLNNIKVTATSELPTIDYILGMYIGMIVILCIIAVVAGRKLVIDVHECSGGVANLKTDNISEDNSIINVIHVTKKFGQAVVLNDVNISFEKGKIHGLIGRNGSGKTMLMKCICGFVPITQGEIFVNGKMIGKDIDVPDKLGAIIETPGFLYNYSGYNNLKFLAAIQNKISKDEICDAIKLVGLDPDSKKHVGKYSLGMRQRLGLAQALMENPDILLLDEPMNGLDKHGVMEMRELFKKLADNGKTIIMANHSSEDIEALCDTVCEMDLGVLERIK